MPEVLALIPARGGSKGLPGKNLRPLLGHPLVAWAVAAGKQAQSVTRTICSTDDPAIAEAAQRYGAEVPFLRPADLAQDQTLDLPVFQHALRWLAEHEGWRPEIVVQLRPTSPIRLPGQVDRAVELLREYPEATAARTVCPAPSNPFKMWRLEAGPRPFMRNFLDLPGFAEPYNEPRQVLPEVWWQTGTIDAARSEVILGGSMTGSRLLSLPMEAMQAVDIDGEIGLRLAEVVIERTDCIRPSPPLPWDRIRLLVLDVDGTLTPGTMYYDLQGESLKRFHTHDGQGIKAVARRGVRVAIITGESTAFTTARAEKLGITDVALGVDVKLPVLLDLCRRVGVSPKEVAYVGDDVGDLPPLIEVARAGGIACAVADARPEVRRVSNFLCPNRGGFGAVRDVCDRIVASVEATLG
ncbi:MAG: HAD family hydrolase [Isosphaeraceae bacterium]